VADIPPDWHLPPVGDFTSLASPEAGYGNGDPSPLSSYDYTPRPFGSPDPAMTTAPGTEPPRGRHYSTSDPGTTEQEPRGRHSSQGDPNELMHRTPPPTLAAPAPPTPPPAPPLSPMPPTAPDQPRSARHRGGDDVQEAAGQHEGGQPLSELLTRLQASSGGGGRRRRRDE
jgi:hypothetical protein